MLRPARALVLASLCVAPLAYAQPQPPPPAPQPQLPPRPQPTPPPPSADKLDAKQLMQTGVRLIESGNYLGALAIFKDAYARFPSAKILLNIGTTNKLLDRKADAANAYQRYLDSPDADEARRPQVVAELTELDKAVGIVELTVTPPDADVRFGADDWMPAAQAKQWRVAAGSFNVDVRKPGYQTLDHTESVTAGQRTKVALSLTELPKQIVEVPRDDLVVPIQPVEEARSRIGALAMVHVSVVPKLGSAALVGATVDVLPALAVDAAVLLGPGLVSDGDAMRAPPSFGGYLGGSYAFLPGSLRPRAGAGMTMFSSDGVRLQVRGAGGVELVANRNLSVTVEVGAEVPINPEDDIRELAIVPSLGVTGRL